MRGVLITSYLLCCSAAAAAEAVEWPAGNIELLHSARLWEARERGDLALLALKKLVAARPDAPEALVALGELDLRLNDFAAAAEVAKELAARFKASLSSREFALEYRVATRDRVQWASIRRLYEIGAAQRLRSELERLFPAGAPSTALGIDYYLYWSGTPNGFPAAYEGLKRLAARNPDDPRYREMLARLMVQHTNSALYGLKLLETLSRRDDVAVADIDRWVAAGLRTLGPERAPDSVVRAYLRRHPEDGEVAALQTAQQRVLEEQALLSPNKLRQMLPNLQQQLSRELSAAQTPSDARAQARLWLERSRASLQAGRERLAAAEMRAALAFSRSSYEAQIAVAQELEAQGATAEAGELLASASRLAASSAWLFETYIHWLTAHERLAEAVGALRARDLDRRWTARSRDALLASTLDQLAAQDVRAGRIDAAISDLEAAIRVAPRDPWLRYRLALQYSAARAPERGRDTLREGVALAPRDSGMLYAQALYLSGLEDFDGAFAALNAIDPGSRTADMDALRGRLQIGIARQTVRALKDVGDLDGARAALRAAEPLAAHDIDLAAQLAYLWIELGVPENGIGLVKPYVQGRGADDAAALLIWAQVLESASDSEQLGAALQQLREVSGLTTAQMSSIGRLQRALDLRIVRALVRDGKFADAVRRLDELLTRTPQDRELRVMRADVALAAGHSHAARDRYAALVAEDPDDLSTRLSYVRALTESGNTALALAQLRAVEARMLSAPAPLEINNELALNLARCQLALGEAGTALRTLRPLLAVASPRPDVLMLAARAELTQRHFAKARAYFERVADAGGAEAAVARRAAREIQDRLAWSMAAGAVAKVQPGGAGMSQIDSLSLPTSWLMPIDYESRVTARADAVILDAGRWSTDPKSPALIGSVPSAGPAYINRFTDDRQSGLAMAVGYQTDSLALDIGTTPLGFLLPKAVGGVEWTPAWHSADITLGVARRAVASSELSYAGLRDPITGTPWGGVVQTGPYAGFGVYRESYGISGSLQLAEITGTRVLNNEFGGARLGTNFKVFSSTDVRADAGLALNYWNYQHNLSDYTFGSGGYYSPHSYVSIAAPFEVSGRQSGWTYKMRIAPSFSVSQVDGAAFYPDDSALQASAAHSVLPAGYSVPYFPAYHSSSFGFSASAAGERLVADRVVVGFLIDIDRTDYYHPSTFEIYIRHAFAPWRSRVASPPRPIRPYNQ